MERMSADEFQRRFGQKDEPEKPKASKYGAVKAEADGHKFDSKIERDRYLFLSTHPDVLYVDVHPVFTLPGSPPIRYRADFLVHRWSTGVRVEDVKGMKPKTDFLRLKAVFDKFHPFAPLHVVTRTKGEWKVTA